MSKSSDLNGKWLVFGVWLAWAASAGTIHAASLCGDLTEVFLEAAARNVEGSTAQAAATAERRLPPPSLDEIENIRATFSDAFLSDAMLLRGQTRVAAVLKFEPAQKLALINRLRGGDLDALKADYARALQEFGDVDESVLFLFHAAHTKSNLDDALKRFHQVSSELKVRGAAGFGLRPNESLASPDFEETLTLMNMMHAHDWTFERLVAEGQAAGKALELRGWHEFIETQAQRAQYDLSLDEIAASVNAVRDGLEFRRPSLALAARGDGETYRLSVGEALNFTRFHHGPKLTIETMAKVLEHVQSRNPLATPDDLYDAIRAALDRVLSNN